MHRTGNAVRCVRMRCDIDHQLRNNLWCLFPKVQCGCGYRKLYDGSQDNVNKGEPTARIPFYIHDFKWVTVDVESGSQAATICDILVKRSSLPEDPKWCIVEYCKSKNLRRVLEDSDDVLRSNEEFLDFSNGKGKMYFEYINNKELTFVSEKLVDRPYAWFKEQTVGSEYFSHENKFCFVVQGDDSITMLTECWYKVPTKNIWNKGFLLLQNGFLKLVEIDTATKIIKNNKPNPDDIERQMQELNENEYLSRMDIQGLSRRYQWIYRSSSSPQNSEPVIKYPVGLDGKELKVYTYIKTPWECQPPTNHVVVLVEKLQESDVKSDDSVQILKDETSDIESENSNNTKQTQFPKTAGSSRRQLLNWSSNLKARFVGRKKEKDETADNSLDLASADIGHFDEDTNCNGVKGKRDNKEKKKHQNISKTHTTPESDHKKLHTLLNEYVGADESTYIEKVENGGHKYKTINIAFDTSDQMATWVEVLRFTKNGYYLRMNSNIFRNKLKAFEIEEKKRNFAQKTNYLVKMDFTGPEGKIVEENDPLPSTSSSLPQEVVEDDQWLEIFFKDRKTFETDKKQFIFCKRQSNLPETPEDIQKIIDDEEEYVEMFNTIHKKKSI